MIIPRNSVNNRIIKKFKSPLKTAHISPPAKDLALCPIKQHTYKERPTNTTALK